MRAESSVSRWAVRTGGIRELDDVLASARVPQGGGPGTKPPRRCVSPGDDDPKVGRLSYRPRDARSQSPATRADNDETRSAVARELTNPPSGRAFENFTLGGEPPCMRR